MVFTMPTIRPSQPSPAGGAPRTTFRPPWVKEGPPPIPMPSSAPWMRSRDLRASKDDGQPTAISQELQNARDRLNAVEPSAAASVSKPEPAPIRRLSKITIIPSRPSAEPQSEKEVISKQKEVNSKPNRDDFPKQKEQTKPSETVKPKQTAAAKEKPQDAEPTPKPAGPRVRRPQNEPAKEEITIKSTSTKREQPKEEPVKPVAIKKEPPKEETRKPSTVKKEVPKEEPVKVTTVKKETSTPPPPPAPPGPPPPPPPPGLRPPDAPPITGAKLEKIEALRSRPRRRPDWGTMMKEIESNRKLNHVVCNDRSAPLLATPIKVKEQFMYESEKPNVHNILLDQIQSGVRLKSVKCNDRSKPILDGLRKFRRQMTIEEQIQKSEAETVTAEVDELDDIDRVRDDLQSTKQMLALELRNKEAIERENKKLLARLLNLEVELEKERAAKQMDANPQSQRIEEEKESRKLKSELAEVQKVAEEMENKYHEAAGLLELTKGELEDLQRKNQIMERRLANYANRDSDQPLVKQQSSKRLASTKSNNAIATANQPGQPKEEEESEYEEVTDTESEEESSEEEEDKEALQEKRTLRELKLLTTKLKSYKDKEEMARKERVSLKDQLKVLTKQLNEEKKKYKVLQKEVDSMANVLKDDDEEESDDEEEEEEEEESESESDSEESEDESEGDLPPESPAEAKKTNLNNRAKRHENLLAVLKKGNYMLKGNVDRIKDDLFRQKEMAITLQEDLNSVLAELG